MGKFLFLSFFLFSLLSCEQEQGENQTILNAETTISTDIDKLAALLDFETYKPTKVKFKYVSIDHSQKNETVSKSSDYSLQALLYFDSLTFEKFHEFDRHADYIPPNYTKEEFTFDWLDKEVLTELENANPNYHGHPDFFFRTTNGKSWYLDKKILIQKRTN